MENKIGKILTKTIQYIQFRVDTTRFLIDKPSFDYQPLPWVGINKAHIRGSATIERWNAIKDHLDGVSSLKDIGCCVGYFCHKAASEYGIQTIGIDLNDRFLRIARYVASHIDHSEYEVFYRQEISPVTIGTLPKTDATILFSVWHHWVCDYGLEEATSMLQNVWSNTGEVMFFESGEEETKEEFHLPFNKNASVWLKEYLLQSLPDSQVEVLGKFEAGNYGHYKLKKYKRSVFSITRVNV